MTKQEKKVDAVAFYNPHGFANAYNHAMTFAGEGGRIATLPDIIDARLSTSSDGVPWTKYFGTMSAEYVGLSRAGNPIAIVAHGIGPMHNLEGIVRAYTQPIDDRRNGHISQDEFYKLESGHYGDVDVIDLVATWNRREYQFSSHPVTRKEIEDEPLWQARLGKRWEDYVTLHTKLARQYYGEHATAMDENNQPCILGMECSSYSSREMFEHQLKAIPGTAIANLLVITNLRHTHHSHHEREYKFSVSRRSLASEINCYEWSDYVRLLGIRSGEGTNIHPGLPNYPTIIKKNLHNIWRVNPPGGKATKSGFWHLINMDDHVFTDRPKDGNVMDSGEPEFMVTSITKHGEPVTFRTPIGGHPCFFKYSINEVKQIAPVTANAYIIDDNIGIEYDTDGVPKNHLASITFYRVEVDTSQRLLRMEEIYKDFDLTMMLIDI